MKQVEIIAKFKGELATNTVYLLVQLNIKFPISIEKNRDKIIATVNYSNLHNDYSNLHKYKIFQEILLIKNSAIDKSNAEIMKMYNITIKQLFLQAAKCDKSITMSKYKKTIDEAKVHLLDLMRISEYAKRKRGEKT